MCSRVSASKCAKGFIEPQYSGFSIKALANATREPVPRKSRGQAARIPSIHLFDPNRAFRLCLEVGYPFQFQRQGDGPQTVRQGIKWAC